MTVFPFAGYAGWVNHRHLNEEHHEEQHQAEHACQKIFPHRISFFL